ncbi:MAG: hypothetical protein RL297_1971 [Pseudomonadota bacterium]|jgi:hypothetical protein
MKNMIRVSLLTNVLVLIPVCLGLLFDAAWVVNGYGAPSPARGILLSIYGAILMASLGLLWRTMPIAVASLLLVQVLYKITTPLTVGALDNPVVISNLVIAALHGVTLVLIFRELRNRHHPTHTSAA